MAGLTTHVLDTSLGRPAAGVTVELFRLVGTAREKLAAEVTNQDGRLDGPLLGTDMKKGPYELVFHVGRYFAGQRGDLPEPAFLDQIPVRFAVADEGAHYHVPLLVSPFGYATYRGS
jgi:5-hydroxyisourate hydrolase